MITYYRFNFIRRIIKARIRFKDYKNIRLQTINIIIKYYCKYYSY